MNRGFFQALLRAVANSKSLMDLRLEFLDLEQIYAFIELFEQGQMQDPIVISMSDFGRTDCCWLIRFPEFAVTVPSTIFQWCLYILNEGASIISNIFKQAVFHGEPLEGIELKNIHLGNGAIGRFLSKLQDTPINLSTFDLSLNPFGDPSVDVLCVFCELSNRFTQFDGQSNHGGRISVIFSVLGEHDIDSIPISLKFSFLTNNWRENVEHSFLLI
jgi:hypothetical protein